MTLKIFLSALIPKAGQEKLSVLLVLISSVITLSCHSQQNENLRLQIKTQLEIRTGAERTDKYLPLLKGKNVAIVANQTSVIGEKHLVDTLQLLGVKITCVFAPEHGFRGEKGAGEKIKSGIDEKTGLKIVSLYGKNLMPSEKDLEDTDIVIFDIQDVGARFYTYISTLEYVMEACASFNKDLIILDRPNPNGHYVDGPVLEKPFKSFVGMNYIPVVHGMTVGEYALMLNGEKMLKDSLFCRLKIIEVENYSHSDLYQLPIPPSPNLPNMNAVYLYPTLCFFEGTKVSLGRGTPHPFQVIGWPGMPDGSISMTPVNIPGVVTSPPYKDTLCEFIDMRKKISSVDSLPRALKLEWIKDRYRLYPEKEKFFNNFFNKLAGNSSLQKQIRENVPDNVIRKSWEPDLGNFKMIRKKYLLYPDFE
ncbi:MAG: DUF1343 domain-containing protein [Bacteroidetes bacterium]|nr:MAG: DUF1343 domain-containing protein [Bacteroidota bacterium]REK08003.1 MAG: DUF1343 domain-containing protein [Bacteroidota bacterium]REK32208.1 MAG: DUF1343 domain-containing protein [Bacteroidota bacterium]REK47360.1 MAG: DUF1343 domain-containing protein [Bacteroidota bacterium]